MVKIKVKYFDNFVTTTRLRQISIGDWIDLSTANTVILKRGESACITLGVAMELPEGYEAIIVPRSSTFKRYGILQTNSIGVVDESYNGDNDERQLPVYCTADTAIIPVNTRICQFRIIEHQPEIEFEEVEVLGNENRGGFGSTGYGDFSNLDGNQILRK